MKIKRLIKIRTLAILALIVNSYSVASEPDVCDGKGEDFSFTINVPSHAAVDEVVQFNAIIESKFGHPYIVWEFDVESGTGIGDDFPNPTHIYKNAGNYKVRATVTDEFSSACRETNISISSIGSPPVAIIKSPNDSDAFFNTDVTFSSEGSYDPDGQIVKYQWTFGDGTVSYEENPTHRFSTLGHFPVTLKVTDNSDISDESTINLSIKKIDISIPKALAITDELILDQEFSLSKVLRQINSPTGDLEFLLFRNLWSFFDVDNCETSHKIEEFPFQCHRQEFQIPSIAQMDADEGILGFKPVGIFNRLDLADSSGQHCGEYRIIYSLDSTDKNRQAFIIFEAQLPNVSPSQGVLGCMPIAEFLNDLSQIDDITTRKTRLSQFYFNGLNGFPAVVSPAHYSAGKGQVRTNTFFDEETWQLREFNVVECNSQFNQTCFKSRSVKDSPFDELFNENSAQPKGAEFRNHLLTQIDNLATEDLNKLFVSVPDRFNAGAIDSQGEFGNYVSKANTPNFKAALQAAIESRNSSLAQIPANNVELCAVGSNDGFCAEHLIARVEALSCGGCHDRSNNVEMGLGQVWPKSLRFFHVDRRTTHCEHDSTTQCFRISPALNSLFLPERHSIVESMLQLKNQSPNSNNQGTALNAFKQKLATRRKAH